MSVGFVVHADLFTLVIVVVVGLGILVLPLEANVKGSLALAKVLALFNGFWELPVIGFRQKDGQESSNRRGRCEDHDHQAASVALHFDLKRNIF